MSQIATKSVKKHICDICEIVQSDTASFFFLSLKAFHALPAITLCLCFQVEGYRFSFKLLTVVTLCVVTCSVYRMA